MNIVIFGANGPTGRLLTRQALDEGHAVTAFTRHPDAFPLKHERLRVVTGNVLDLASVERAVAAQDAVLSILGVPYSRKPITVFSQGTDHIMRAMLQVGVHRLVCVSSTAVDPGYDTGGGFLFEKVLTPLITHTIGRTMYADQKRMEELVIGSDLDWTVVRPSGLFVTPTVTDYRVTTEHTTGRFTSRTDLADFMLQQVTTDQYVHKVVAVATVSGQPNFLKFLWNEAISKKAA